MADLANERRQRIARVGLPAAVGILLAAKWLLVSLHAGWVDAAWVGGWFYPIAWWSAILAIDFWVFRRRGESMLLSRPREFLFQSVASVTLWFLFELINLRLENWRYVGIEGILWIRWIGYPLSFATVLPAIFEMTDLLETFRTPRAVRVRPLRVTPAVEAGCIAIGVLFLVAPLLWPLYAFPLIWGAFVFLLEPGNRRAGVGSLLRDLETGDCTRFVRLLLSGLVCGALWEFWNYWATAKWEYTVPWVGRLKLFEMPVAGYLGFPPFAVECYVMMEYVARLRGGRSWEWGRDRPLMHLPVPRRTPSRLALAWILTLLFWGCACYCVDGLSIRTFAGESIESIGM